MIAQDFARRRVLAGALQPGSARGHPSHNKNEHSHAYGVGSMCADTGKRPARAQPAQFVPGTISAYLEATVKKQTTFEISMSGLVQYAG